MGEQCRLACTWPARSGFETARGLRSPGLCALVALVLQRCSGGSPHGRARRSRGARLAPPFGGNRATYLTCLRSSGGHDSPRRCQRNERGSAPSAEECPFLHGVARRPSDLSSVARKRGCDSGQDRPLIHRPGWETRARASEEQRWTVERGVGMLLQHHKGRPER